jgi:putative two-component system protein, hydrogenase maturation factor HypX/HoxX
MSPWPLDERASSLRILFLVSAHNSLSQAAWIALTELGHEVEVAVVDSAPAMEAAVREHDPELIVCPFLKKMIPESIWSEHRCLIVHPGPPGDRGPSSLDWTIELEMREWGVTVLEANGEFDAGEVWAARSFRVRDVGKSSLYRHEVRRAAIEALVEAVGRIARGEHRPQARPPTDQARPLTGQARPLMGQDVRAIDWGADATETVVRKIRAGEGHPGVLDTIRGTEFHLFGVHPERVLHGRPGEIVAQRKGAICRATVDGAVWITHLKRANTVTERIFKLPATRALALAGIEVDVAEVAVALDSRWRPDHTYREIAYEQAGAVGYLHFEFYNGAMCTEQCWRLRDAYAYARSRRQTKVIVLMGGSDYFSTGIHLGVIEAAKDPAYESWRNLHAINDVVRDIIETDSHLVISALAGDAAAGGVPLALAADHAVGREDIVLNPYYQHMGGLFGSEYWTYLLPRRIGVEMTARIIGAPFNPLGACNAVRIGLLDAVFDATLERFQRQVRELAEHFASNPGLERRLERKRRRRARDEQIKPLQAYRDEELARSNECFFGADPSYHRARQRFVYKLTAPKLTVVRTETGVAGRSPATGRAA